MNERAIRERESEVCDCDLRMAYVRESGVCVYITLESEICFTCVASVRCIDRSDRELRVFTQKYLVPTHPFLSTSCPHLLDKRSELLNTERSHPLRDEARKLPLYLRRVNPNR